ncbi:MAG TPA: long-chain fatty acid--CoA ligase, partial [Syntrophomonas sp.]|nr:long-chain fatty acid--CoA ligase [Syntrophomonas sp.]
PKVLEACTIGVPDEKRGETVKVFVVLKPGQSMTEEEVIDFCKQQLAPYKVPKIVEFIDSVPRTSVGKPDRKALRAMEEAKRNG